MVDEVKLSSVLREFARTLATDFPIQEILDHLVERIVGVLPITSVGVTLLGGGRQPRYVAASDARALRYERLQADLGEGPCVVAFESGAPVLVPDLATEGRFRTFSEAAREAGLGAVFTFPLHQGENRLGALDLYRETPGVLDPAALDAAQTLADVAAAYLVNASAREEAQATSDQHRQRSLHDPLTGLPNRVLLQDRLQHAEHRAARTHECVAVLFADLNGFKLVNDTYGHDVGDELLVAVARRLEALVRPDDTLARLAGDEFVFLCENLSDRLDVEPLVGRIERSFDLPFNVAGVELLLSASVGVAVAGPGETITDRLVAEADLAMYQAKREGALSLRLLGRRGPLDVDCRMLLREVRAALESEEFEVAYQPLVRSVDGAITGLEALLRWTHPSRGPVPPALIVSIAEHGELISELGAWVLRRSCEDLGRWRRSNDVPLDLAVNVSVQQLHAAGFVEQVASVLDGTGTPPTALVLEITESVLMDEAGHVQRVLHELRETGIRIALDDFGTGFSSLSYLRRVPVDLIKIDRSFVVDIGEGLAGGAILKAITDLAHVLHLPVTAEGVETQRQHDVVRAIGCEFGQGFFYSGPMSAAGIEELLAGHEGGHLPQASPVG